MSDPEKRIGKALALSLMTGQMSGNEIVDINRYINDLKTFKDFVVFLKENVGDTDDWNINISMNEDVVEEFLERSSSCFELLKEATEDE